MMAAETSRWEREPSKAAGRVGGFSWPLIEIKQRDSGSHTRGAIIVAPVLMSGVLYCSLFRLTSIVSSLGAVKVLLVN